MRCEPDRLEAYRIGRAEPGDLPAKDREEREEVESHLRECEACRRTLESMEARERETAERLALLDAEGSDARPDVALAYQRFRARAQEPAAAAPAHEQERAPKHEQEHAASWRERLRAAPLRWRAAAVAFAAAAALLACISYAPAREVLADFLGIFRVQQFSAVSVDRAQLEKLAALGERLREGGIVRPIVDRKPGEPRDAASASEASALAGFDVLAPSELPAGTALERFAVVSPGPVLRFEFDPRAVEAELAAAGISGIDLPELPEGTPASVRAEVAAIVRQVYTVPAEAGEPGTEKKTASIEIVQAPAPSVTFPPGVDAAALGTTYLEMLGLPRADAERVARAIDWTSTLVIPMPAGMFNFREIDLGGTPALYMEGTAEPITGEHRGRSEADGDREDGDREGAEPERKAERARVGMLLWQRDGVVTSLAGSRITASELLRIAESMR